MKNQNYLQLFLCFILQIVALLATGGGKCFGEVPLAIDLSGDWDFTYTNPDDKSIPEPEMFLTTMPIPGCWDDYLDRIKQWPTSLWMKAHFNHDPIVEYPIKEYPNDRNGVYLLGAGWYRKRIEVPGSWAGQQVTLNIGRVVMEAKVYLNGTEIYHHEGYSTTWQVPLGTYLKFGQTNELVIMVDNTRTDRLGCIIRGFEGRSGGIFGAITLKVAGVTRIADMYVWMQDNKLKWQVELKGQKLEKAALRYKVYDLQTKQTLGEGSQQISDATAEWTSGTFGMKRWSDRQPNLYGIEISLWLGQECFDVHRQSFGLRSIATKEFEIQLNGNPIYLRGTCDCAYYPETCTPPIGQQWYRDHVRKLKKVGFNWIRFHTYVPLEPYLDAADEFGILVQIEAPVGMTGQEWIDILRFCRKHPSVLLYCGGNEENLDEEKIEFLRERASELRQLAPDALFNPQEALRGVEYHWKLSDFGEGLVKEPYLHNASRLEKLKSFSDVFGHYSWGTLSYNTLIGEPEMVHERLAVYERPCLTHELGLLGCYIDLDLEHRYVGTRIDTTMFQNFRQYLTSEGVLDRTRRYYLNSCEWQRLLYKDAIEKARGIKRITGYDMLGANDISWLCGFYNCGIMNEFDDLKPAYSVADVLTYNNESVLLLAESKRRKRNLSSGGDFESDVFLSWYGTETLQNAIVRWCLQSDNGQVFCRGEQPVKSIESGNVEKIMTISFTIPALNEPVKANLEIRLSSPTSELSNNWDYWIFPENAISNSSIVNVVTELNDENFKKLVDGGRIVLFGHKPFPANKMGFNILKSGNWKGHLATVIADHPLTNRFPNDGYCSWQFYSMLTDSTTIVFNDFKAAFDPIIDVASGYKNVIRQASLFEWQVGNGRLLVCSLNLQASDPAARYLKSCIIDYASSDEFKPKTTVTPEELARIMKITTPSVEKQQDDMNRAYDESAQLKGKPKFINSY